MSTGRSGSRTRAEDPPVLSAERARVERALGEWCDTTLAELPEAVASAVRYSVMGEGKRLRPFLVLSAYDAAGGRGDAAPLAAAIEIVHAYSLVHDDLPCMDDDDVRRGRPTTHRAYGEVAAMVAGVTMVPWAARCAYAAASALGLPPELRAAIVRELMRASGASGMVGGQLRDLGGDGPIDTLRQLEHVHRAKTGALIVAAMRSGAIAAGATPAATAALGAYGVSVGLAFQIADDVLDATSSTDSLGKTAGRDAALGKRTYVDLLGIEGALARARALVDDACSTLERAGLLTSRLEWLARYAVERPR